MTLLDLFKTMEYGPAPESPAAVNAWLEEHGRKFGLFINNEWVTPKAAKYYSSYNPSSGELLAETAQAEKKDVDAALAAARAAFESWSQTPGVARARYMYAIARNVQKHARLLSVLESMDNGKPIRESRDHLTKTLVQHEDVDAVGYFGSAEGSYWVEYESAANMKRTWVGYGLPRDWMDREQGEGHEFLHEATQVKNIWVPMGE